MTVKRFTVLVILGLLLFTIVPVFAKRLLPRAGSTQTTVKIKGVLVSVKLRSDRKALILNFSNLTLASKVDYQLSYETRGTVQGVGGSISTTENTAQRELLFGTCSSGVCRYDSGITNARLVITTVLKTGKKIVKTYRIRV